MRTGCANVWLGSDIEAVHSAARRDLGHPTHDAEKYKWRHLVENFFCAIKAFRRIATRYEKTDTCFAAMINLVAVVLVDQMNVNRP